MIIETKEKFKIKSKNELYYTESECNHSRIYPCGLQCAYSLGREIISVGARYKHILLQFNYAVEIGAYLAYIGHYRVTKDNEVLRIAKDERAHQNILLQLLFYQNKKPSIILNLLFTIIGKTIQLMCYISPKFLLNVIACFMEKFAIFNYSKLASLYPEYKELLLNMQKNEEEHERYFKNV